MASPGSSSYETVRFISPWGSNSLSPHGLLLRVFQQFNQMTAYEEEYEDNIDGSHLPMVQPVRDLQRRVETLDAAAIKYRHKSSESTSLLQGDLAACDDSEARVLTDNLMRSQKMLGEYLEGLHPILREQKEAVKRLSEYLTPPTVELFHKKASHILKDAPHQQISMLKKNTCTICMDASADCVIKRTCCDAPSHPPHHSHHHHSSSHSSSHHPQVRCERDVCKCGPTMCKDCLLTHYWTSTGKGSKSYARCVCCRAEFCLKDVFPVEYVEDEAYCLFKAEQEKTAKKEEEQEKRGGGRRTRKSNLAANTTTTTTTTTTTSSSSLSPYLHHHHSPSSPTTTPSSSFTDDYNDEYATNRKRRRTSTSNYNNYNNNNSINNTYNNNYNSSSEDNNDNTGGSNNNSDNEGRSKYHLRSSSQRRAEKQ